MYDPYLPRLANNLLKSVLKASSATWLKVLLPESSRLLLYGSVVSPSSGHSVRQGMPPEHVVKNTQRKKAANPTNMCSKIRLRERELFQSCHCNSSFDTNQTVRITSIFIHDFSSCKVSSHSDYCSHCLARETPNSFRSTQKYAWYHPWRNHHWWGRT